MSVEFKIGYISHRSRVPFALKKNTMHDTDLTFVHSGKMQYITDNDNPPTQEVKAHLEEILCITA